MPERVATNRYRPNAVDTANYSQIVDKHLSRRLRWFDDGAPRLRLVLDRLGLSDRLPVDRDFYACPCCMVAFPREAVAARILTDEHVPADGVGGHRLLLTCKDCNNSSGTSFDAHAVRRLQIDNFVSGVVDGRTHKVTSYADGIPLRGTIERTDGGIQIVAIPEQNNVSEMESHFKALHSYRQSEDPRPNHSFTVHTRYDEGRARISWIRSAYLAAFAALGWSYIFRSVMNPVRAQLQRPNEQILPTFILQDASGSPDERRIVLVDRPAEICSVAVTMGRHTVFLPALFDPIELEHLNAQLCSWRGNDDVLNVNFHGKAVPWPKWPTYFMDPPY